MYKVMVVVQNKLGKCYLPIIEQDKKVDADREVEALKTLNPGCKFAIMDED
jgi:hypothetical protein